MSQETIREALLRASRFFERKGIRSPQFNAEVLLMHVLGVDRTGMLVRFRDPLLEEARALFDELVQKRGEQVPLQHLTGVQEFYGREFLVSGAVLIPRPETELLIERVLEEKEAFGPSPLIVDIGTGSGAIAVTLALEWPGAQVVAVDLSPDALSMAKKNAERLGAASQIQFVQGDLVTPILERGLRPDIVVSNPPYIPTKDCEKLDVEVRDHEPRLALDGGEDGMHPYRVICRELPKLWPKSGPAFVAFEVGIHQDRAVENMIRAVLPCGETGIVADWQGIGRVIWGRRER
jgi:release factor glutamine methyltransferase